MDHTSAGVGPARVPAFGSYPKTPKTEKLIKDDAIGIALIIRAHPVAAYRRSPERVGALEFDSGTVAKYSETFSVGAGRGFHGVRIDKPRGVFRAYQLVETEQFKLSS